MMNKSALTLFVIIALAEFTNAYPKLFTTIHLGKQNTLRQDDGTFNAEEAMRSASRTKSKHEQNLRNFQRNVPGVALSEENVVTSVAHVSRPKTDSEPLTDQEGSGQWTGLTSIGDQPFIINFDTGSSDLWVPSSNCTTPSCAKKHKYNPAKSTTSKAQPGQFSIEYADNSTVQGPIYTDTVSVAGIQVTDQYLAAASVLSPMFTQEAEDGTLGMAFPAISVLKHTPFLQHAIQQDKVATGAFAFYLAESGSELHLGGTNPQHYSGAIEYHPVVNTKANGKSKMAYWLLGDAKVSMNGKRVPLSPFQTIIDTGTTLMYGPADDVKKVYAQVEGSKPLTDDLEGFYSFPCDNVPKLSFKWGNGKAWAISEVNFNSGPVSNGSSMCVGALGAMNLPFEGDVWLLGDSFMTNVYTVFDVEKEVVGFGQLH